jgi:cell division protein FtsN
MDNLIKYMKQNKAQVSNTTIWIILALLVMFISFYMFSEKADLFTSLIGVND